MMIPLLPFLLLAAQGSDAVQSRQVLEVDADGARVVLETQQGPFTQADGFVPQGTAVTTPRWQMVDGGLAWIGGPVDLGDNGATLIAGRYLNNEGVSVHAATSADELFFHDTLGSEGPYTAIADRAPVAASLVVVDMDPSSNYDFEATLSVFGTEGAGGSDWTYVFPRTLNYFGGGVAISDDGQTILAWKADPNIGQLRVEAFDRNGISLSSGLVAAGSSFHARQARLSDDGSRAYLFVGTVAHIYDVASATVIHTHNIGASFDSHAFAGDGRSFAYGYFGYLRVYSEAGGNWSLAHTENFAGGTYVGWLDLDADGDRLAYQVQRYTPAYDHNEIGMVDVPTSTLLWSDSLDAPGTSFQLVCSGVELNDAGTRLAGCSWGDSLNMTPEGYAYDDAGNLTASLDLGGSAFSVAMAPDGEVWATGTKAVHANTFGNGGAVTVCDTEEQALHIVGVPRSGATVQLQIAAGPSTATVGFSSGLAPSSTAIGVFDIDLGALLGQISVPVPPGGYDQPLNVPPNPGLIGTAVHVQGYTTGGGGGAVITNKVSARILQ